MMFRHKWKFGKSTLLEQPKWPKLITAEGFPGCFLLVWRGWMVKRYLP